MKATRQRTANLITEPSDRVLQISRVFDAPRSLVFEVWTRQEHLCKWCAPRGFAILECNGEFRVGGAWHTHMRSPDGNDHVAHGTYREIIPNERLVFTHSWKGENGEPGHETLVTLTFTDEGRRTRMNLHQAIFKSAPSRDGHQGGWNETLERLGEYLNTIQKEDHNGR